MVNKVRTLATTFGILFTAVFLNAQNKTHHLDSFQSPFQNKKAEEAHNQVLKPDQGKASNLPFRVNNYQPNSFLAKPKEAIAFEPFKKALFGHLKVREDSDFSLTKEKEDDLGFTHYYYQQRLNDIPVQGGEFAIHVKNDQVKSANGKYFKSLEVNTQPSLEKQKAISIALDHVDAKQYQWEAEGFKALVREKSDSTELSLKPKAELVIAPINGQFEKANFRLSYKVNVAAYKPFGVYDVYVDANTGEIINKIDQVYNSNDSVGTANTLYSGQRNITAEKFSGGFRLRESGRGIETYNMKQGTSFSNAEDFTDNDNQWTEQIAVLNSFTINQVDQSWWYSFWTDQDPDLYFVVKDGSNNVVFTSIYYNNTHPPLQFDLNLYLTNPPYEVEMWDYDAANSDDFGGSYSLSLNDGQHNFSGNGNNGTFTINKRNNLALDAHWGMEKTYDYYLSEFGRTSYDNNGSTINSFVNYDIGYNNAYWDGRMVFGNGDGSYLDCVVGLDVMAHEFTHAVTDHTASLIYQDESGALNESFSDIFGTAIEFYAKPQDANWTIGEEFYLQFPFFMRSMANPNAAGDPDTYQGNNWVTGNKDNGGVHTNSGVQNYWFYLLSKGGSGVNDKGNGYNVSGTGLDKAEDIAYRNLTVYLSSSSNYWDAYYGSLQAVDDLYGSSSSEYWAVKNAWYAVGIGSNPNNYCDESTLTAQNDTIRDGSGSGNYQNNTNCTWKIQPEGADSVELTFTKFDVEADYDTVIVYNGPDTTSPVEMVWWGNSLPPTITSDAGALTIQFKSDGTITQSGWEAYYNTYGNSYCSGVSLLDDYSGSFSDGSGSSNYGNNSQCAWLIAPPCASSVTLSYSSFDTELNYDGVIIYDGNSTSDSILAIHTGSTIPSPVSSTGGEMLVVFTSDYAAKSGGVNASYTATGSPDCSGTTNLTSDSNTLRDGSGPNSTYCNNTGCSWLIQPDDAQSITFDFLRFDLEKSPTNSNQVYAAVEVYDGTDTSAPLLGRYTGSEVPSSITSTGGSMYVKFYSDAFETDTGWKAYYQTNTKTFCSGKTHLTAKSDTFSDGSGQNNYGNNTNCQWLISPSGTDSIQLNFTSFNLESGSDFVRVYDGADTNAPVLGTYSGSNLPPSITSSSDSMLIWFVSDEAVRKPGWSASYCSYPFAQANGDVEICENSTTTLNASGGDSYNWSPSKGLSCTNCQNPTAHPDSTTTYTVTVTNSEGCQDSDEMNVTVDNCTGIDEASAFSQSVSVFPNPNEGKFTVELFSTESQTITTEIFDMTGRLVYSNYLESFQGKYAKVINLQQFSKGVYNLKIKAGEQIVHKKILLK